MNIFKSIFARLVGKSNNKSNLDGSDLMKEEAKKSYEEASGSLVEKLGEFRMKYSVYFRGDGYNEKNAMQALPQLEETFGVFKELLSVKREYGEDADIDDYYIYNLVNCYVSIKKYDAAYETLKYGLSNLKNNEIYNLTNSLEIYLKNTLLDGELKRFFSVYEDLKGSVAEKEKKRFRRHIEKELSDYFDSNIQNLDLEKLDDEYSGVYLYKKIRAKTLGNKMVFDFVEEARELYNKKEYQAASDKFSLAVDNANKLAVSIGKHYELHGDIQFRLENYEFARVAYEKSLADTSYKHRVYKKIGDSYKRENSKKNAFFAYLLSLARKKDYKTSQNMIQKLNYGHELNKILEFCDSNSCVDASEFKRRAQKHFSIN